jgi:hypothetical protein
MRLRCNGLFVFLSGFYNWRAIYDKIDLRVTPCRRRQKQPRARFH